MRAAIVLAMTLIAASALAQAPSRDTRLLQLAETLGRQHYLRTLCNGADDQTWRTRMARLRDLETEADPERLEAAFNRGFTALARSLPVCGAAARAEAAANARRGAALAAAIAENRSH